MAPKKISSARTKHQAIMLDNKLTMIKRHEKSEKVILIAWSFRMSQTIILKIVPNKDKILAHIKSDAPGIKNTIINKKRGKIFEEMEQILSLWIDRLNYQLVKKSFKQKVLFLRTWTKKYWDEKDVEFKASQRWFMRFKEWRSYHSKKQGKSASADKQAAVNFPKTLAKIVEENRFLPEQIFNVDETGLNRKKLPDRSFISPKNQFQAIRSQKNEWPLC